MKNNTIKNILIFTLSALLLVSLGQNFSHKEDNIPEVKEENVYTTPEKPKTLVKHKGTGEGTPVDKNDNSALGLIKKEMNGYGRKDFKKDVEFATEQGKDVANQLGVSDEDMDNFRTKTIPKTKDYLKDKVNDFDSTRIGGKVMKGIRHAKDYVERDEFYNYLKGKANEEIDKWK